MSHPCAICGIPLDAQPFDESGDAPPPDPDHEVILASFTLPPQYCGVLQVFAQFTDANAANPREIKTPQLIWSITSNDRPLHPYGAMSLIINPWGFGSFTTTMRLEDSATVAMVVRGVTPAVPLQSKINHIAGRIAGRYWYNRSFGGRV